MIFNIKIPIYESPLLLKSKSIQSFELGGVVAGGVRHHEKNEIGDYGIPVIDLTSYKGNYKKSGKRHKIAEVESNELVFNDETAKELDVLYNKYISCKCENVLLDIGKLIYKALENTSDETCRTSCEFAIDKTTKKIL